MATTGSDNVDIDATRLDSLVIIPKIVTAKVTLNGSTRGPVFSINHGNVAINRLTLTGGGHVFTGGVENLNGDVTLAADTIRGNAADLAGGGVYNNGDMTLIGDTITFNTSGSTDLHNGDGGGVYNDGSRTRTGKSSPTPSAGTGKSDKRRPAGARCRSRNRSPDRSIRTECNRSVRSRFSIRSAYQMPVHSRSNARTFRFSDGPERAGSGSRPPPNIRANQGRMAVECVGGQSIS